MKKVAFLVYTEKSNLLWSADGNRTWHRVTAVPPEVDLTFDSKLLATS